MMDRFRRIANLWNWLPAFRGVAEHESIQQAASSLGVSPSALSRTVKLLEDATGIELFVRHPAGLRLTEAGRDLLIVTRDAMRAADDFIGRWGDRASGGPTTLTVGCVGDVLAVPIARALPAPTAAMRLVVRDVAATEIEDVLLQGNADVVLTREPVAASESLESRALGSVVLGVYAMEHTAAGAEVPIVVPAGVDTAGLVVATAGSIGVACILARAAGARVVLPDAAVADLDRTLVRVSDHDPPLAVHAVCRKGGGGSPTAERVRDLLATLEAALSPR